MTATIAEERHLAKQNFQNGVLAIFRGRNLIRFVIAAWPKVTQQFVGLAIFNTYATYFCE
jgi:SP family general alpha glucoside:H+ symporter-like MFS transporter